MMYFFFLLLRKQKNVTNSAALKSYGPQIKSSLQEPVFDKPHDFLFKTNLWRFVYNFFHRHTQQLNESRKMTHQAVLWWKKPFPQERNEESISQGQGYGEQTAIASPPPLESVSRDLPERVLTVHQSCIRTVLIEHFNDLSVMNSNIDFKVVN